MGLPYHRLYWRMALYIGIAIAAFVLLGGTSLFLVASYELQNYITTRQSNLGQEAADVLAAGGQPALERWLQDEKTVPSGVIVYVFNQDGEDILGRRLPGIYTNFVDNFVISPTDSADSNYRPLRLAPQIIGPRGEVYTFLVMPNRVTLWGSPAIALGIAAAAVLVIGTVAWLIARTFGRPIGALQRAVRELASSHFDARVPDIISDRQDELGALAADFNAMADQIAGLLASRQQLMRELSHELRSPMARLQAALALAASRRAVGEAEKNSIEQEIRRMDRVIGDLLRYSRLDAVPSMSRRLVRLDDVLAKLAHDEEVEAQAKHCRLVLDQDSGLAIVGDEDLLWSGFENILRNAIRFAPQGSAVEITARRRGDSIQVEVLDRGPGVPPAYLTRIFEPYFRAPNGGPSVAGTGLGLAIARRVFEIHEGNITASSRAGGGLIVTVQLPAAVLT